MVDLKRVLVLSQFYWKRSVLIGFILYIKVSCLFCPIADKSGSEFKTPYISLF